MSDAVAALGQIAAQVSARTGAAAADAVAAFASEKNGIGARFAGDAWAEYGWTARSAEYQARQGKRGRVLPFVSWWNHANKFVNTVRVPGVGHRVSVGNKKNGWTATLVVPAARGLNPHPVYLAEWSSVRPADDRRINTRLEPRIDAAIETAITEVDRG